MFEGILGSHDEEGVGEHVRHSVDRDLSLAHRLKEGRLGLRRSAVDLVRQNDLRQDRPRPELELAGGLIEDVDARQVAGQHIGRELHSPERASDGSRQAAGQHRLAYPRHVLDQDVPASQQSDENELDRLFTTQNHALNACRDFVEQSAEIELRFGHAAQ